MMKQLTALVNPDGEIERLWEQDTTEAGPVKPPPRVSDGYAYVALPTPFDMLAPPSNTCVAKYGEDGPYWVETSTLAASVAAALVEIDNFADAARLAVVGDAARIKEYERAQAGAEAYRDTGFTGSVPPGVASWAYAKRRQNWTAQQAAEDILAASARWYAALDGIRALRLDAKEGARAAATIDEVAATVAFFRATLTAAMQGVQ